jgi:hypothetical protein
MSRQKQPLASPPASPSTTGSLRPVGPADDDAPTSDPCLAHTIESLARTYGATDAEVNVIVGTIAASAVVSDAERCATTRVCDEAAAVGDAARAFFTRGDAPVASLRMGEVVVRVMVTCAARASAASRGDACARVERRAAAPVATVAQAGDLDRARGGVRQLANALRGVCAGDAPALERIRLAERPGASRHADAGPGRALTSLVAIGRELVDDPARATQAAAWGVTPPWLDALEAAAATARRATAAREAPAPAAVDTTAQRHWRGLTVTLLRRVFGAFAAGHAVDPAVPTLTPRYLRKALAPKRAPKKSAAKPNATKPATPAPAPTA